MSTEAVVSLRIKDIIDGSVRVGSRPLGGGAGAARGGPGAVSPPHALVNCPILLV